MTEYELQALLFEAVGMSRGLFEFWLAITFSVLVAGHYVLADLDSRRRRMLLITYGLISIVFVVKWFDSAFLIYSYAHQLLELGGKPGTTVFTRVVWLVESIIILLGPVVVIFYLLGIRVKSRSGKEA